MWLFVVVVAVVSVLLLLLLLLLHLLIIPLFCSCCCYCFCFANTDAAINVDSYCVVSVAFDCTIVESFADVDATAAVAVVAAVPYCGFFFGGGVVSWLFILVVFNVACGRCRHCITL